MKADQEADEILDDMKSSGERLLRSLNRMIEKSTDDLIVRRCQDYPTYLAKFERLSALTNLKAEIVALLREDAP
jgi:hypothetical protein